MLRNILISCATALVLTACGTPEPVLGPDGKPMPQVYTIRASDAGEVQYRVLDSVNALRQASGLQPVELDSQLNAAAKTHSRDMARQNRAWHFGSDGSSPIDRVQRVGYNGRLIGENISETYETETETLSAWMADPATHRVIMSPDARRLGFSWEQTQAGKLWWTMILGT